MIIVLEGPEGVGKTTAALKLLERFDKNARYVYFPGSWESLSPAEKSAAQKSVLICDREKYVTHQVYSKALPGSHIGGMTSTPPLVAYAVPWQIRRILLVAPYDMVERHTTWNRNTYDNILNHYLGLKHVFNECVNILDGDSFNKLEARLVAHYDNWHDYEVKWDPVKG